MNSSHVTARAVLLDAVRRGHPLSAGSLTLMGVAAAATGDHFGRTRQTMRDLGGREKPSLFQHVAGVDRPIEDEPPSQIAFFFMLSGSTPWVVEAFGIETNGTTRSPKTAELIWKIAVLLFALEPGGALGRSLEELASRFQIEVQSDRPRIDLGLVQGIRSIVVATVIATVGAKVASALAIVSRVVIQITALADRPLIGRGAAAG